MCHDRLSREVEGQRVHTDFISSSFWNVIDSEPTKDYCDPRVLRGNEKSILLKRRFLMFPQSSSQSPRYRGEKKRAFDGFKGGNLFWKSKPGYFHFMLNFRNITFPHPPLSLTVNSVAYQPAPFVGLSRGRLPLSGGGGRRERSEEEGPYILSKDKHRFFWCLLKIKEVTSSKLPLSMPFIDQPSSPPRRTEAWSERTPTRG